VTPGEPCFLCSASGGDDWFASAGRGIADFLGVGEHGSDLVAPGYEPDDCFFGFGPQCTVEFFFVEHPDCGFNLLATGFLVVVVASDPVLITVVGETGVQTGVDAVEACNNANKVQ